MHGPMLIPTAPANAFVPTPVTIRRTQWETDDTFTLFLEPPRDAKQFTFTPGQFNMLYVFGYGESAISISSDPRKTNLIAHTIHRVGLVTSRLAQKKRGDIIGLRGPYGSSWPVEDFKGMDICIIAGGIGLAPLRPALYSLFHRRKEYGRIILLYGARSPLDLLYRVELEEWQKKHNIDILITVDRGDFTWKGHIGFVSHLLSYIKLDARATAALICGPEIMMQNCTTEILNRGVPESQVVLSLERNMKCAVGVCGHCQYGPYFICKDGPVFPYPRVKSLFDKKEV